MNKKLILTALMLVPMTGTLHGESVQKNYVNWCSDPGSGGCPVARVPYITPKSDQLVPYPIPQLVPKQVPVIEPRQYMGVPTLQKAPNLVPNRVPNLVPQPIPRLEPKQVLPEQKIPGFAKTIGRPGEVTVEVQPTIIKEKTMTKKEKINKIDNKIKKTKAKLKAIKQIERLVDLSNKIQNRIENESNSVRGVQYKANNFDYVLGGLVVAGALAVKRRSNES